MDYKWFYDRFQDYYSGVTSIGLNEGYFSIIIIDDGEFLYKGTTIHYTRPTEILRFVMIPVILKKLDKVAEDNYLAIVKALLEQRDDFDRGTLNPWRFTIC